MPETFAVLKTAAQEDQLKAQNTAARNILQNEIGLRVDDLDEVKKQIDDLSDRIQSEQSLIDQIKQETFETGSPAFFGGLKKWTDQHSLSPYLDFLFDLNAGIDPEKIFDKYLKQGADFPVNLTEPARLPIETDLKAGKKPNFNIARSQILHIVDGKIIPQYKSEMTSSLHKQIAADQKQVAALRQRYAAMGGK